MLTDVKHPGSRPKVVVICGSTRFHKEMHAEATRITLNGEIVLVVGCNDKSDDEIGVTEEQKAHLEALHRHKIDMADEVFVVNVGGYTGSSTRKEIAYATSIRKPVFYWEDRVPLKDPDLDEFAGLTGDRLVCAQRGAVYGDPQEMQRLLAMRWTATLQAWLQRADVVVPPHLVGLMLADLKLHRASTPFPKKDHDSYIDLRNYASFAEGGDSTLPKT